jgi:hypothetical protein
LIGNHKMLADADVGRIWMSQSFTPGRHSLSILLHARTTPTREILTQY